MARRGRSRRILSFVLREQIPGIGEEGQLIQSRTVPHVQEEKKRSLRRLGVRSGEERAEDIRYRDLGLNVFDVNAGRAQLADLIHKGRGDQK